ncbi:hypothetical protein [Siccirubricoccus deserti]|uniref:hypothetical protein n=1 Tax=Siccirubricoccus deserti TaxID=2013562 RepID=UPI0036F2536E
MADAGYQGPKMAAAVAGTGAWILEVVRRCDQHRFVVLPKRWIVERTLAWISRPPQRRSKTLQHPQSRPSRCRLRCAW